MAEYVIKKENILFTQENLSWFETEHLGLNLHSGIQEEAPIIKKLQI